MERDDDKADTSRVEVEDKDVVSNNSKGDTWCDRVHTAAWHRHVTTMVHGRVSEQGYPSTCTEEMSGDERTRTVVFKKTKMALLGRTTRSLYTYGVWL